MSNPWLRLESRRCKAEADKVWRELEGTESSRRPGQWQLGSVLWPRRAALLTDLQAWRIRARGVVWLVLPKVGL